MSSRGDPLGAGLILFVGGVAGFVWGLRCYLRRRLICQTPTSKVASAALGGVELCGRVGDSAPMVSPICQTPCVWYRYLVEKESKDSKGRTHWSTVLRGKSTQCFYVQDETGCMLIDPEGAQMDVPQGYCEIFGGLFSDIPMHLEQFLNSEGESATTWLGTEKRMRFTEWRLQAGDPLFALGTLVERRDLEQRSLTPYENLILRREGRYFLISNTSEKDEIARLFQRALWGILGGAVAAMVGLGILLGRMGVLS